MIYLTKHRFGHDLRINMLIMAQMNTDPSKVKLNDFCIQKVNG